MKVFCLLHDLIAH